MSVTESVLSSATLTHQLVMEDFIDTKVITVRFFINALDVLISFTLASYNNSLSSSKINIFQDSNLLLALCITLY